METTRHLTATVYTVKDGATALHEHKRHGITIPPGGHVDRDELPHEAGLREVREETGLEPTLLDDTEDVAGTSVETLPRPRHHLLTDITVVAGDVYHQHVDCIYCASVRSRQIRPADGEADVDAWSWYSEADLESSGLEGDVVELGLDAIAAAESA